MFNKKEINLNDKEYNYELLLKLCRDDYFRLIDFYKKVYDKINITLVFSCALLTIIVSGLDFSSLLQINFKTDVFKIVLILINIILQITSFIIYSYSLMLSISLLKGKTLVFLDLETIVNEVLEDHDKESNIEWILENYVKCINENKKTLEIKESKYNQVIHFIGVSTMFFLLSLLIRSII